MFDKEKAKEQVKILVDKYNRVAEAGKLKRYKEEDTKAEFIEPLFEALGWDVRNITHDDEVTREDKVSRGRVDYAFRIDGIPKLFLEAKAIKEDLEKIKFAEQAINYAWHKGATWAVLTDFEGVMVFNAEWKSVNPLRDRLFYIKYDEFLDKFDQLLLLSRESLEKGLLDKEAEKWGKKAKKIPVDKQLLSDLTKFRELLTKNILKNNPSRNLSGDELDEVVQRILDRLIFIRTLEDKQLEAPVLQALIREDKHKRVYKKLSLLFSEINEIYNSKLFAHHLCQELVIDDEVLEKIIHGLFKTCDNTVHYDFGVIDADVLGNIYEQYLGHILKKTDKRAKLADGKTHRKEQGIYYTPTYVVDYIVKNTVGELAKSKKFDLKNIKILDPACGSGSFLMKAFDYLVALDKKRNKNTDQTKLDLSGTSATYGRKIEILKNNIFGVDLDSKATEIAQLNLLLKAAEKKHRLPTLQENIKVGNSLIDDSEIAGNKAFKWNEEFGEIMDDNGFDVVIGNPPYVFTRDVEFLDAFKEYIKSNYFKGYDTSSKSHAKQAGKVNLYAVFLIKSILLLKERGLFGFIIPNNLLRTTTYDIIRKFILDNCKIIQIVDLGSGVFEGVTASTIILILQKEGSETKRNKNKVIIYPDINNLSNKKEIEQKDFLENTSYTFNITLGKNERTIFGTIEKNSISLGKETKYIIEGIVGSRKKDVVDSPIDDKCKKFLVGKDIGRYKLDYKDKYIIYDRDRLHRARPEEVFTSNKIIIQRISGGCMPLRCVLDKKKYYTFASTNLLLLGENSKFDLIYVMALLNSKLINWYYVNKFTNKSTLTVNISKTFLEQIPIKNISKLEQKIIIELANKMLSINEDLIKLKNKTTDEKARLEKEAEKVDKEIDREVYKIYGLTKDEIKIIEEK
ncbi:MAG: N-6 DNA methylase [Candidatus Aenigmarchaeota archaeon]|nr:N-6 DNA methylase [Candidatus Aenigmarchaeota archaeon]